MFYLYIKGNLRSFQGHPYIVQVYLMARYVHAKLDVLKLEKYPPNKSFFAYLAGVYTSYLYENVMSNKITLCSGNLTS